MNILLNNHLSPKYSLLLSMNPYEALIDFLYKECRRFFRNRISFCCTARCFLNIRFCSIKYNFSFIQEKINHFSFSSNHNSTVANAHRPRWFRQAQPETLRSTTAPPIRGKHHFPPQNDKTKTNKNRIFIHFKQFTDGKEANFIRTLCTTLFGFHAWKQVFIKILKPQFLNRGFLF